MVSLGSGGGGSSGGGGGAIPEGYVRLASAKPQVYAKYLKGWKNRINSLRTVVAEYERDIMFAGNGLSTVRKG